MNSIRVRFKRGNEVKFISHLDLMKVFERTLRRSGVPVTYSQGFNPHPQMVFGLPLSVGVTSEAEYADFELDEEIKPLEFMSRMNEELPCGISIIQAEEKYIKDNIMATINGAVYDIYIFLKKNMRMEEIRNSIYGLLEEPVIIVRKEGKSGVKDVDIKPMIHDAEINFLKQMPSGYEEFRASFCLTARLSAGSVSNLKPELLITALSDKTDLSIGAVRIHRKELYVDKKGMMANPMEVIKY